MKILHKGEKGFTLIELLIVVAIIGILAAVIIPNVTTFMQTGNLNALRTEGENVKTAALAFYADWSDWPVNSANLTAAGNPGGQEYLTNYASRKADYTWTDESITGATLITLTGFHWDAGTQTWQKGP